jgi:hypothetical protein
MTAGAPLIGAGRLIDATRVMARACPGHPRRGIARRLQNSKYPLRSRARYFLPAALRTPTWMAGTSPAMTESTPLGVSYFVAAA